MVENICPSAARRIEEKEEEEEEEEKEGERGGRGGGGSARGEREMMKRSRNKKKEGLGKMERRFVERLALDLLLLLLICLFLLLIICLFLLLIRLFPLPPAGWLSTSSEHISK